MRTAAARPLRRFTPRPAAPGRNRSTSAASTTRTVGMVASQAGGAHRRLTVSASGLAPAGGVCPVAIAAICATAEEATTKGGAIAGPRPTSRTGSPVTGVARIAGPRLAIITRLASLGRAGPVATGARNLAPSAMPVAPGLARAASLVAAPKAARTIVQRLATTSRPKAVGTSGIAGCAEGVALIATPGV